MYERRGEGDTHVLIHIAKATRNNKGDSRQIKSGIRKLYLILSRQLAPFNKSRRLGTHIYYHSILFLANCFFDLNVILQLQASNILLLSYWVSMNLPAHNLLRVIVSNYFVALPFKPYILMLLLARVTPVSSRTPVPANGSGHLSVQWPRRISGDVRPCNCRVPLLKREKLSTLSKWGTSSEWRVFKIPNSLCPFFSFGAYSVPFLNTRDIWLIVNSNVMREFYRHAFI